MLEELIEQLRADGDPRKVAVAEWAASGHTVRLKLLGILYARSSDDLLRQVGEEAARLTEKEATPRESEPALLALRDALESTFLRDRVKATECLHEALQRSPGWSSDPVIADYAGLLLGKSPAEAIALLTAPDSEAQFSVGKGATWWKQEALRLDAVSWKALAWRAALYLATTIVCVGIVIGLLAGSWLPQLMNIATAMSGVPLDAATLPAGTPNWLPQFAFLAGVLVAADFLLRCLVIHFFATILMQGQQATFGHFLRRALLLQTGVTLAFTAIAAFVITSSSGTLEAASPGQDYMSVPLRLWGLLGVWPIAFAILMTLLISETYHFDLIGSAGVALAGTFIPTLIYVLVFRLIAWLWWLNSFRSQPSPYVPF